MVELTKLQDELLDSASKYALCTYILISHLNNSEKLICDLSDTLLFDAPYRNPLRLVKLGGVLIYSTCSIDPEENEGRVEAFLLRHPVRISIVKLLLFRC